MSLVIDFFSNITPSSAQNSPYDSGVFNASKINEIVSKNFSYEYNKINGGIGTDQLRCIEHNKSSANFQEENYMRELGNSLSKSEFARVGLNGNDPIEVLQTVYLGLAEKRQELNEGHIANGSPENYMSGIMIYAADGVEVKLKGDKELFITITPEEWKNIALEKEQDLSTHLQEKIAQLRDIMEIDNPTPKLKESKYQGTISPEIATTVSLPN